ncbi:phosphatase PAP2 family protein [Maribellus maritimus]|uniref:phosphatase PAP2 family protein n=1 Tax=Maribellus maritimus TaxID=2870838 RepID=UPI001EEA1335|nr:phosphatase PAP2 family protein [Maribellus maritimus]MCG6188429.1 phosphatase PAP2 family protein [Maribellus maritimus]
MKKKSILLIFSIVILIVLFREESHGANLPKTIEQFNYLHKRISFSPDFGEVSLPETKSKSFFLSESELKKESFLKPFHNDSIHKLNFRYADKKRGLSPYIAPALLIGTGTALHFMPETKRQFRDFAQEHFAWHGNFDDYAYYTPVVVMYSLHALGIKGKNNFGNMTAIALKSFALNAVLTTGVKRWVREERPGGDLYSFPSGHTSKAFTLAHIMHKEYGEKSIWFSIGAYSCATTVGLMRIAKNAHWISDVLAGAGTGILSTELIYLTHQYKWDNKHIKNLDIFPFQIGNQKGLTLVYTF